MRLFLGYFYSETVYRTRYRLPSKMLLSMIFSAAHAHAGALAKQVRVHACMGSTGARADSLKISRSHAFDNVLGSSKSAKHGDTMCNTVPGAQSTK